jgi:hypothetical protein
MNEFVSIRAKAKERYDGLLAKALQEYDRTLSQIDELEYNLFGRLRRRQAIAVTIESVIPADKEFSIDDVMAGLLATDDEGRVWNKNKVYAHIAKMRRKGLVRQTRRHSYNVPALYVRSNVETPERPFADVTLSEVVPIVLGDKQMTELELTVAVIEAGYESKRTRQKLREAIGSILRKEGGRFKREGEKWAVATTRE